MRNPLIIAATLTTLAAPAVAQAPPLLTCEQLPGGGLYCFPQTTSEPQIIIHSDAEYERLIKPFRAQVQQVEHHTAYVRDPSIQDPLPTPDVPYDAGPRVYLKAAIEAIRDHNAAAAQEALEEAETRLLDRSVPLGGTDRPSRNRATQGIHEARNALASGDWDGCEALVERVIRQDVG